MPSRSGMPGSGQHSINALHLILARFRAVILDTKKNIQAGVNSLPGRWQGLYHQPLYCLLCKYPGGACGNLDADSLIGTDMKYWFLQQQDQ